MDFALVVSALLMGLAGSVHCVAMCSAPSAAVVGACTSAPRRASGAWLGFHAGRLLGYALAGAVAAGSVGALARWSTWSPALRPIWALAHLAALMLGLWLLWRGRQPDWLEQLGRSGQRRLASAGPGWQRISGPTKAAVAGSAWFAWPCGLLQSALVVAALANTPWGGAATMSAFALASAPALGLGPWLWLRWQGGSGQGTAALSAQATTWAIRFAGATLAAASAWALGHDAIRQLVAYCLP